MKFLSKAPQLCKLNHGQRAWAGSTRSVVELELLLASALFGLSAAGNTHTGWTKRSKPIDSETPAHQE